MGFLGKLFGGSSGSTQPPAEPSSEQFLFALVEKIQSREGSLGFDALQPAEQVFFCVWTLEAEINSGGFEQFYLNSSGDIASQVVEALYAIDAPHTASIVERANALFGPSGPPANRDARLARLEAADPLLTEGLAKLDDQFLEYRDNLSELLARFMRSAE